MLMNYILIIIVYVSHPFCWNCRLVGKCRYSGLAAVVSRLPHGLRMLWYVTGWVLLLECPCYVFFIEISCWNNLVGFLYYCWTRWGLRAIYWLKRLMNTISAARLLKMLLVDVWFINRKFYSITSAIYIVWFICMIYIVGNTGCYNWYQSRSVCPA